MRLAHQPPTFQLCRKIAVRHRLIGQQTISVVDQKSRRIQHHQHFRSQRFGNGLAGFVRDGLGNLRFLFEQPALKLAHNSNPLPHANFRPGSLRDPRSRHGSQNMALTRAIELAQNRARRRIYRHDLARRDLEIICHTIVCQSQVCRKE